MGHVLSITSNSTLRNKGMITEARNDAKSEFGLGKDKNWFLRMLGYWEGAAWISSILLESTKVMLIGESDL